MAVNARSLIYILAIYSAFFASGASSLIAEVTWNRMLIVIVGNSVTAAAIIISVFMGGLGIGSYVAGRFFSRRAPSLIPYVFLELTIAVYVLLSPSLLNLLADVFMTLADSVDNRVLLTVVRLVVTIAALLLPAMLMGATFPAIVSGTALDSSSGRTARTGYLYSFNTLGAAVGTYVGGFHLLLEFGVQFTLIVAFCLYVFAVLSALLATTVAKSRAREIITVREHTVEEARTGNYRLLYFLYVATFGIGFVALAYEVLLTRLGILYLGNSIRVFPLVLTSFLLGTGISAVLGTRVYDIFRKKNYNSNVLFGLIAVGAGIFVLLTPYLLLEDWVVGSKYFAQVAAVAPKNPLPVLLILLAPTLLLGGLLPLAIRMVQPETHGSTTREAAKLYALNTAGGLLGAGLANHFLLPLIGIQGVIILLVAICATVGVVTLLIANMTAIRWALTAVGIACLTVVLVTGLPRMMDLYAKNIAKMTGTESTDVLLVHEGMTATVAVLGHKDPKWGTYRDMYLNGVEEASTRYWHVQLFKLLGILPTLMHESEEPKDALVVAFGAGITAGSVLASDQVASLDVVDLNPDIEGINDLFTKVNGDVFHKPRFHFINDDGRNYLVTSRKKYDLIISDSTHPRAYDSWILYTEDFYKQVREHLRPGGIFAQWVPVLTSMQGDLIRIHFNTFQSVFPNATLWYVYGSDQAFLVATPEPMSLNVDRLQGKLDNLPEWFRADEYQIDTVARVSGFFWLDEAGMTRMIGDEKRINTDDQHYFSKQSALWPLPPEKRLPFFQASIIPYLEPPVDDDLRLAIKKEQNVALWLSKFSFFGDKNLLFRSYCAMPENGNVQYHLQHVLGDARPDYDEFCSQEEIKNLQALIISHPDNVIALNDLASTLSQIGQLNDAALYAKRALQIEPDNGIVLDTYGWILYQQGKYTEALDNLKKSEPSFPDHPVVLYHLGATYHELGEKELAKKYLEKALSVSRSFEGAEQAAKLLEQE